MQPNLSIKQHEPLCLIGIGSGGCSIVERVAILNPGKARYVGVNSEWNKLSSLDIDTKIYLGNEYIGQFGCGGNLDYGQELAEDKFRDFVSVIDGCSTVVLIACMGGGCASGGGHIIARIARSLGVSVISLVTSPFQFEGRSRSLNAQEGIAHLRNYSDSLLVMPNDQLLLSDFTSLPIAKGFQKIDERVEHFLISLHNLLSNSCIIPLEQDILNSVIRSGKGIWCENFILPNLLSVKEQANIIMQTPAYSSVDIRNAETCLAYLSFNQNTPLEEIHLCIDELRQVFPTQCIFQAAVNTRDDQNPQVEISLLFNGVGGTAIKPVETESVQIGIDSNKLTHSSTESIPLREYENLESTEIPAYIRRHVNIK